MPRGNSPSDMVNATGHAVTQSRSARINGRIVALKRPNHAARSIAAQRQPAHAKHAQQACEKNVTRRAKKSRGTAIIKRLRMETPLNCAHARRIKRATPRRHATRSRASTSKGKSAGDALQVAKPQPHENALHVKTKHVPTTTATTKQPTTKTC